MSDLKNIVPTKQELEQATAKQNKINKTRKANKVAKQMRKKNRKG